MTIETMKYTVHTPRSRADARKINENKRGQTFKLAFDNFEDATKMVNDLSARDGYPSFLIQNF